MPIRVLIVDDSAVVRQILTRALSADPEIEVVGAAPDPYVARQQIANHKPDVLTLDVEMPRMDGITFLRHLMRSHPLPVVVLSSLTTRSSRSAVAALEAGAVEVVAKPDGSFSVGDLSRELATVVKRASKIAVRKRETSVTGVERLAMAETTDKVLAIGASTGGVGALTEVLRRFPATAPGTVIVQHMPPAFTRSFADRLNQQCAVELKEAADGDSVAPGRVLIAPGGCHMELRRSGARYHVTLVDGPEEHHQKPAVDRLFRSVGKYAGANAIGAVLTGMGADGAAGLLTMKNAGAATLVQDEKTSVVWGMPGECVKNGAAEKQVPIERVAEELLRLASQRAAA
ncbi:MAG: chemotaxis response regulator protein-glutamate methylesterase [Planctomycetota bacterium]